MDLNKPHKRALSYRPYGYSEWVLIVTKSGWINEETRRVFNADGLTDTS